jgi:hypothetical protein
MPKTWAKPFNEVLKSHSGAWKDAKTKPERKAIIEAVEKAIHNQVAQADGEDGLPSDLGAVSIDDDV